MVELGFATADMVDLDLGIHTVSMAVPGTFVEIDSCRPFFFMQVSQVFLHRYAMSLTSHNLLFIHFYVLEYL